MKTLILYIASFCLLSSLSASITPDEALKRLVEGNTRYTKDQFISPDRTSERREALVSSQKPYAIIVGCSDSRVSPEIIFDQGIGDLFIVRVAGNVVGPIELDSIEYSATALGSSLVLVMGHENCGAVQAVLAGQTKDIEAVAALVEKGIAPAKNMKGNSLENAVKLNAESVAAYLKTTPVLAQLIKEGKLQVVSGYYNLASGKVEILPELGSS